MILETFYKPTVKNELSGLNQRRYYQALGNSLADDNFQVQSSVVGPDTVRVIQGASWALTPDSTQQAQRFDLRAFVQNGVGYAVFSSHAGLANGQRLADLWTDLNWLLGPGDSIVGEFTFSSFVAINTGNLWLWGYEVPRANLEL